MITRNSGSQEALDKVKSWVEECVTHHEDCGVTHEPPLPKRTLFIPSDPTVEGLRLRENNEQRCRYTTLSHCWGDSIPLRTTQSLLKSHKTGIAWSDLPKTFQDAVIVTRHLGVEHLWIDALCIIQDDEDDWARESAQMGAIYTNSFLTIASARATNCTGGCFHEHESPVIFTTDDASVSPTRVVLRLKIDHRPFLHPERPYFHDDRAKTGNPLLSRKWFLQERYLSKRILYFSLDELVWHCLTSADCECGRVKLELSQIPEGRRYRRRRNNFDSLLLSCTSGIPVWQGIVQQYSAAKITKEEDTLPALSGVASALASSDTGKYLAGMWEKELPASLCWWTLTGRRPQDYIAPSFSWASINGGVEFERVYDLDDIIIDILHSSSTPVYPAYPFGQVKQGHVKISGLLLSVTCTRMFDAGRFGTLGDRLSVTTKRGLYKGLWDAKVYADDQEDVNPLGKRRLNLLPLIQGTCNDQWGETQWLDIRSLILQRATNGCYHRVGYVRANTGDMNWYRGLIKEEITIV